MMAQHTLKEARHIGIVACTADGAALCYRTICREAERLMGAHAHPEMTLHTFSLHAYLDLIDRHDWDGIAALMSRSAAKLVEAGAKLIICPNNTLHRAFDLVESPVPWLHIAEAVAAEAVRRKFRRVGVIGTGIVMEGSVYSHALDKAGIGHMLPEAHEQTHIDRIIRTELIAWQFPEDSRAFLRDVIDRLRARGCDAVILACTELPLLISKDNSALPLLDSARLLAGAALHQAIPAWRNLDSMEEAPFLTHSITPTN